MGTLSERDICSKFITPALIVVERQLQTQIREEMSFTKGRIIVRGKLHSRETENAPITSSTFGRISRSH